MQIFSNAHVRQFIRFVLVGLFNTGFGYGIIFLCMYLFGLSPELSNILGYGISVGVSYLLHRRITFRSQQAHTREVVRFLVVFAFAYAANLVFLIVLVRWLGVDKGISQLLAGVVYVAASYLMNKFFVFQSLSSSDES
ncbi:GtrA family protein [Caballeronia novacaledonica]|uniref:GtrA family protein n=1 Tax=Caballeronia novacaledonica TaxID=1544861 RepID=A0ACB5QZJ7_9BURK|nr:GtrA family protein [Caballeronia novacaledonica]